MSGVRDMAQRGGVAECPADVWDRLVAACPWGTFYHSTLNLDVIRMVTGAAPRFVLSGPSEAPRAGLVWCEHSGPLGVVANALPFFGSYGEAVAADDVPEEVILGLYRTMLDDCRSRGVAAATVITSPFADGDRPAWLRESLKPDMVDPRLCQATRLPDLRGLDQAAAERVVMDLIDGKARTSVRKSRKEGVGVRLAASREEVERVMALHVDNIGGKGGRCKPSAFFAWVYDTHLRSPQAARLMVAEWRGEIIGGVVLFEHQSMVEYHTVGMNMEHRALAPLNAIIFDAMTDAARRGLGWFNFGGTWATQEGVYRFKASFGAADLPYAYLTWLFDQRLLSASPGQLAAAYPDVFVLPYSRLAG